MQAIIKRAPTGDRGPPVNMTVDILTTEQLSPKMHRLPNGSLLCTDVPIARVGWMMYGPGETPIEVGTNGVAYVERTADELFSPETIGSFMASAIVDEHPDGRQHPDGVTPKNWKHLAKGFSVNNVRRGTGDDADVLLADLVVTDKDLIDSILAGKREVSCGYDANYQQTGPGQGRQTRILGNHIALVQKGRCGPRCAIGDRAPPPPTEEGTSMTNKRVPLKTTRRAVIDSVGLEAARQRVADAQAEVDELETEGDDDNATHIHIHTADLEPAPKSMTEDRMSALEATVGTLVGTVSTLVEKLTPAAKTADQIAADVALAKAKEAEDDEADPKTGKTMDSAALAGSYAKVIAQAEVLVPGFRMPTFDAALARKATVDSMCQARRKCLDMAYATKDGQELVDSIGGTKDLDLVKMDCAATAVLFTAASGAKALLNNRAAAKDSAKVATDATVKAGMPTNADLNKVYTEFWAKQQNTQATTAA